VVREFAQPSSGNVTLFIDAAQRALLGTGRGSSLEHVVRTTVAFANRALRSGHRVEVVAEGKESRQVPAGRGLGHLQAILDLVVAVRPDGAEPLEHVLARHRRRLRRGDTVVYPVSPYLAGSAAFFREVAALRQMGLRQVALVLDDRTFRALRYEETAERIVAADLLARFRALGAEAFLVSCGADLASTFSGEAA
jgi:uncharacterized protein (DUF58 family)